MVTEALFMAARVVKERMEVTVVMGGNGGNDGDGGTGGDAYGRSSRCCKKITATQTPLSVFTHKHYNNLCLGK